MTRGDLSLGTRGLRRRGAHGFRGQFAAGPRRAAFRPSSTRSPSLPCVSAPGQSRSCCSCGSSAGARTARPAGWRPAIALFAYAIAFSLAYVRLTVGLGALILFGAVQVTMIGSGLGTGERPG